MDKAECSKCGAEVVKKGWFWVLPSEIDAPRVAFCPEGGTHEVDEDDE